jgi:hypothetical protein
VSRKSVTIEFDLDSFGAMIDGMQADLNSAVRPAAQAGAQVLYDEVKRNVLKLKRHTGNLESSIYQVFSQSKSSNQRSAYDVSWNRTKAPHGHLVEFGHLQRYEISYDPTTKRFTTHKDRPLPTPKLVAARPFLRPAMARFPAAMEAAKAVILKKMEQL